MSDDYCINCKKKVPIWIRYKTRTIKYALKTVTYDEVYAVCQFCGREVYDLTVEDMNVKRLSHALSASQA